MALSDERLQEIIKNLARRPGHEEVRGDIRDLLINHLGVPAGELSLEANLAEVRGRIDALLSHTVLEFKRDLRKERDDAENQLEKYLRDREAASGHPFLGIATDGAEFWLYELYRDKLVKLRNQFNVAADLRERKNSLETVHALAGWLSPLLDQKPQLPPEPATIRRVLGRESIVYEVARRRLEAMWEGVRSDSEVSVKREVWAERLSRVYGTRVDDDALFIQHTYLTLVAKTMATLVLGVEPPAAADLLAGKPFQDAGIEGVVESDFFDWVLADAAGSKVVNQISAQVARLRLGDIKHDVLKVLYESLVDPEQRHDLGEYYTPDWLAERVCERVIERPLEQRVLDPSCGSGTFLFHAVRRFIAAADKAGMRKGESLRRCTNLIFGFDIHPVAVINARITYLLAIGEKRLREHDRLSIPVYLGDAMQWGTQQVIGAPEVTVTAPAVGEEGKPGRPRAPELRFPRAVAESPALFDAVIREMVRMSEQHGTAEAWEAAAKREFEAAIAARLREDDEQAGRSAQIFAMLRATYLNLRRLREERRNHIWGYVARNLVRPVWLASDQEKVDVIVGNPPWLAQRNMSREMQKRFRAECDARGLWKGGKVATHQDLSAYFFARCVELYLRPECLIAFVLPYATMSRQAYAGFRGGNFGVHGSVRFAEGWAFDDRVKNLFNVPSCVIIAREGEPGGLPKTVTAYAGELPRRDASIGEADEYLSGKTAAWPSIKEEKESAYGKQFKNGATVFPRNLFLVTRVDAGRFGSDRDRPIVESRAAVHPPWRDLPPIRAAVERNFLYPLLLGESVAPFRLLKAAEAVIPWDAKSKSLIDANRARKHGYSGLAEWLGEAEGMWSANRRNPGLELSNQLDYYGKLSAQMPPAALRVIYAKSGTLPAAAVLRSETSLVENVLYWCAVESDYEARFIVVLLNSQTILKVIADQQSRGQWGPRHFDKLLADAIPEFEGDNRLHRDLVEFAAEAEKVASGVELPDGVNFVRARQMIREALREDGVAGRIDKAVARVLS